MKALIILIVLTPISIGKTKTKIAGLVLLSMTRRTKVINHYASKHLLPSHFSQNASPFVIKLPYSPCLLAANPYFFSLPYSLIYCQRQVLRSRICPMQNRHRGTNFCFDSLMPLISGQYRLITFDFIVIVPLLFINH